MGTEGFGISRRLSFANGKDFTFRVTLENRENSSTVFSGSYLIKGDSLKLKIDQVVRESADVIMPTGVHGLYKGATFSVKEDTLTLNYHSDRGGDPVKAVTKFVKLKSLAGVQH